MIVSVSPETIQKMREELLRRLLTLPSARLLFTLFPQWVRRWKQMKLTTLLPMIALAACGRKEQPPVLVTIP